MACTFDPLTSDLHGYLQGLSWLIWKYSFIKKPSSHICYVINKIWSLLLGWFVQYKTIFVKTEIAIFLQFCKQGQKVLFWRYIRFLSFLKSFIFTKLFQINRCPFNMLLIIGQYKFPQKEITFHQAIEDKLCFKVRAKMEKSYMPSASKWTFTTIL